MSEVCSRIRIPRECEDARRWRRTSGPSGLRFTLTTDRFHPRRRLPQKYQNTIQNTYPPLPRPPQTRAAHFKRLYRK